MPRWIWNSVPDLGSVCFGAQDLHVDFGKGVGRQRGRKEGTVYSSHCLSLCPEILGKSSRNQTQLSQWNCQAHTLAVPSPGKCLELLSFCQRSDVFPARIITRWG